MTDLPELRSADCGHGMVPADAEPNASIHDNGPYGFRPGVVCAACLESSRAFQRRPLETKEVRPAEPRQPAADEPDYTRMTLPQAQGAEAAVAGKTEEDCPYPDKRTKDAKDWVKGFREAKGNG